MTRLITVNEKIQESVGKEVALLLRGGQTVHGTILAADGHSVTVDEQVGSSPCHTTVVLQDVSAVRNHPS